MMCALIFTLALQVTSPLHLLGGSYENSAKDLKIRLYDVGYDMEVGAPLSLKPALRHVDFETGRLEYSKGKVILKRVFLFHSPNRSDYNALMGGGLHRGFQRIYITPEERKQFINELKWRVVESPSQRIAGVRFVHGKPQLVIDGVVLTQIPVPK